MLSVYAPWTPVYKNREPWVFSFAANILEEYILNIKGDFTMPPSICVRGIYWSLWLNLSILLLNGVMSVNSASAADEIITDNQALDKSTLNTDETAKATYLPDSNQVIAVAELKQKVISGKQIESMKPRCHLCPPLKSRLYRCLQRQVLYQLRKSPSIFGSNGHQCFLLRGSFEH